MKDALTFVSDPETLAAIARNGYGDPIPAQVSEDGAWVYAWSLEQYKGRANERPADDQGSG